MTKMSIYYIDSTSADGYEVQLYTSYLKKDKCIKTVRIKNTNQSMLVGHPWLKQNKLFKIRIRGYILNSDKQRKYGEWSEWKCYSHSSARVNKILSYANYGGVKLYWDKISGADQYTVYISTKEGSGYKKYCTTKKTSVDVRKYNGKPLKAGNKMYYVRIVPKCKIGKKWYTPDIHENMGVNNGNGLWFNISKEVKWPAY